MLRVVVDVVVKVHVKLARVAVAQKESLRVVGRSVDRLRRGRPGAGRHRQHRAVDVARAGGGALLCVRCLVCV